MKKIRLSTITLVAVLCFLCGCTTGMYSDPSLVDSSKNKYQFFIATGGFSGAGTADQRAIQEINKIMAAKGYKTYKIINRTDKFIPSGFEYTVEFSR